MPFTHSARVALGRLAGFTVSMPVAIVSLCLLAVLSVIGTVLSQDRSEDYYLATFGPFWHKTFSALGLFQVYETWWYRGMLVFLVSSLALALVRHGPRLWRRLRPLTELPPWPAAGMSRVFACDARAGCDPPHVERVLRGLGLKEVLHGRNALGEPVLVARRGRLSKLGFFLIHGAVIVILLGGMATSAFGFRGVMNIPEGESSDTVYIRSGGGHREYKLPFQVRNEAFVVDYYRSGMPSAYRSTLNLHREGVPLLRKQIVVNDPLRYEGVTFYQASFGDAGSPVTLVLTDLTKPGFPQQVVDTQVGKVLEDGSGTKITVAELRPRNTVNLSADPKRPVLRDVGPSLDVRVQSPVNGTVVYRLYQLYPNMLAYARLGDKEMTYEDLGFSPADRVAVRQLADYLRTRSRQSMAAAGTQRVGPHRPVAAGRPVPLPSFVSQTEQVLQRHALPVLFAFVEYTPRLYTGLQVARDPGAPIVWIGCVALVLGLALVFFQPERLMFARFTRDGARSLLHVCVVAPKHDAHGGPVLLGRIVAALKPNFSN